MAFGLVLYDIVYLTLAAALYGGAGFCGRQTFAALAGWPRGVAMPAAALVGLATLVVEVGALTALCPRLEPGRYELMRGKVFYAWIVRSILRRILFMPGIKWLYFNSNVLRFFALRALGARVAFTASMSSDVDVLDPSLLEVGPGAVLGARCGVSGHWIENGKLVLDFVRIGAGALLAADVGVAPGVAIGERAFVKVRCNLCPRATIGARAHVGPFATIDSDAQVGADAKIGALAYVPPRSLVAEGARVEAASASSTRSSAAPAV